jgi:hypothetical protein
VSPSLWRTQQIVSIGTDAVCCKDQVRWKTDFASIFASMTGSMTGSKSRMFSEKQLWSCARRSLCAHAFVLFISCAVFALPLYGQQRPTDYQVKAVYLYNFGKFVHWPPNDAADKNGVFTVCVLGQDPFGPALDATLAGATIDGKHVVAKRISSPSESAHCRILFLGSTEVTRLRKIMDALDKEAVLTVSDIPEFSQHGGMIEFVMEESRVRFEVNLDAAQQAGLTLSSELLKVATTVRRNPARRD